MEKYLTPTYFIDCDSPIIKNKAEELVGNTNLELEKATRIFYFVRDKIRYNPYLFSFNAEDYVASKILERREGWCVQKAVLLTTLARAAEIPSRLGFADIKNHLVPKKLLKLMGTDLFTYHGYSELFLEGKWVKATPAFDLDMCQKVDIIPVEFDGRRDAVFSKYNKKGELHIEYIRYHGSYSNLPLKQIIQALMELYGKTMFQ
jgi:transglutaminase-like putative cysteine protease